MTNVYVGIGVVLVLMALKIALLVIDQRTMHKELDKVIGDLEVHRSINNKIGIPERDRAFEQGVTNVRSYHYETISETLYTIVNYLGLEWQPEAREPGKIVKAKRKK